ncbi:hypothetical protein TSUD_369220 [Trifolium subterraneum]|uniref:F-box domain-containing protein n=1 Tax=Trifolium subterraneum TaxID=3900 RepID=A0A2Z6PL19_TRISU|nr:hypothetical protein TSUD_369220 [Trifolium subterraneum]
MLKIDPGIVERDIDIVELELDIVDPLIEFLSGCPVLETFDTYFDCGFLTKVPVPPSTKRLKLTGGNFSWSCLVIDSDWLDVKYGKTTLGIIGNLQTVGEAYLDIFSLRESEFVDPILNDLQDRKHDLHLLLRHSTSKYEYSVKSSQQSDETSMAESSMKRQKAAAEEDDTYMISSLPDSILCHIMSFLPTRTSVATISLVSPMWRNLWKHLQVFDFTYTWPRNFRKFAFYVNAVLSLRRSRDIRKMCLFCDIEEDFEFNGDCIHVWLCAAIGPRLEELLAGEIQVKVQHSSVHFPSLKSLTLDFDIVDSVVALLSGCPVLKRLDLHFGPKSLIEVPVPPSSKRLKFTNDNFAWTYLEIFPDDVIDERITLDLHI